jgi:hypothetical protein
MKNIQELIIDLHNLAREQKSQEIRKIADDLAEIGKQHSDKGYRLSTLEKQEEFAKKRNYTYGETE